MLTDTSVIYRYGLISRYEMEIPYDRIEAVSMRRVDVRGGNLSLMDYCTGPSFASGGFIADSVAGVLINGSQQQFLVKLGAMNWKQIEQCNRTAFEASFIKN